MDQIIVLPRVETVVHGGGSLGERKPIDMDVTEPTRSCLAWWVSLQGDQW
jgi:hypothetical protein